MSSSKTTLRPNRLTKAKSSSLTPPNYCPSQDSFPELLSNEAVAVEVEEAAGVVEVHLEVEEVLVEVDLEAAVEEEDLEVPAEVEALSHVVVEASEAEDNDQRFIFHVLLLRFLKANTKYNVMASHSSLEMVLIELISE